MIATQLRLIVLTALFLVVSANVRFFSEVLSVFPPTPANLGFLLSLPLLLGCVLAFLMAVLAGRYTLKPTLTVLLLVAAPVAYFSDHLGTVVDESMIRSLLETDGTEASDLLSVELVARVLLLGCLPAVLLWGVPIRYGRWRAELLRKVGLMVCAAGVAVGLMFAFSSHYASFIREYKPLRSYSNPTYPLYSVAKYWLGEGHVDDDLPVIPVARDATLPEEDRDRELMILVIGETARADHFSLYGYSRETNPLLARVPELFVFEELVSCGTSTAVSVPCIFSLNGREAFDIKTARHTENVLDVLQRAGVSVLWRDNNSDSKGVALRVPYQDYRTGSVNPICDIECRDVGMLQGLQEYIDGHDGDTLIVLHQMGNHGPAYYKRYPPEFEYFRPVCRSLKLSDCSAEEINNAYDNAIRYTDWFLAQVIDLLRANSQTMEAAMLYVSDHGESLGENHIYLHGMPYGFAPLEQKHVPAVFWRGAHRDVQDESILERSKLASNHDAISHSLLSYFEVDSASLDEDAALFSVHEHD